MTDSGMSVQYNLRCRDRRVDCAGQVLQRLKPQIGSCSRQGLGCDVRYKDEELATQRALCRGLNSDGRRVSRVSRTASFVALLSMG